MNLQEKREQLIAEGLCNHCLGRQFARLGTGLENYERGAILREKDKLTKEDFIRFNIPQSVSLGGDCFLCKGVFNNLDNYINLVITTLNDYQFNTMLIGTRPTQEMKKLERSIWDKYGDDYAEPLKSELNRLVGKEVEERLEVGVDYKNPEITAVIDIAQEDVKLQIKSLLIYGKYNKYSRELFQTEWSYLKDSIQEITEVPFIQYTEAEASKFHGAGREDADVRCFGKREFVLELVNPKKRKVNLTQLQKQLNQSQAKVEVFNLKITDREKIKELKEKRVDKTYRALVTLDQKTTQEELVTLEQIIGTIEQKTPQRVKKSRGNLVRKREIYKIEPELITKRKFELIIKAEAGAYIKELISSDEGRTTPSVAEILGCQAKCTKLDVIDIDN
ncbi:TIGR01213 family protein [Halobacteroides halobius DSM 5150]|uniref:tRNA pseudouridine(55) synthase n=1 Tax=Halobacteroides halobius (strain ATCC 35273 / DSM 5150 / MD-1) TaxID=748449 RepID=L0K963_HALHC|nr:tRNA pseudouridine(54/55) synthase Pus10 [Halobacteroides halobius]AGB40889.1 TIGR01213 family protein [Halobacteroides halobius DSM 5150]